MSSIFLWLSEAKPGQTLNYILGGVSIAWSVLIMTVFLSALISRQRLGLALYPVVLLYLYLFYIIIV